MTSKHDRNLRELAVMLYNHNAVKFGEFVTKSGVQTPIYCDLRVLISYPDVMDVLADLIADKFWRCGKQQHVCGVPYTALPFATLVSYKTKTPMVMRRKEAKEYGTKKTIEGAFEKGETCLIIEDVVTSGSSVLETCDDLEHAGLKVSDVIVVLNREQGGEEFLSHKGIKMHSLFTLKQLMAYLIAYGCITQKVHQNVVDYVENVQFKYGKPASAFSRVTMPLEERIAYAKNERTAHLMKIMIAKKTNLCVAADFPDANQILNLAKLVGPYVCCFKTHIDIVENLDDRFIPSLMNIAKEFNFLLLEDRKFSDIGKTVCLQYTKGIFQMATWAHFITVHSLTGTGVMDALLPECTTHNVGVFLLAECSGLGSLIDPKYIKATIIMGQMYSQILTGFVCQSKLFVDEPGFLQLTPGLNMDTTGDNLGQQYTNPRAAVLLNGADVGVVGRAITASPFPAEDAQKYRDIMWAAYNERLKSN